MNRVSIPYILIQCPTSPTSPASDSTGADPNANQSYFTLTWSESERQRRGPNYFVSLTNQRVATTSSNTRVGIATLSVSYVPLVGEDPDFIERAIINSGGTVYYKYGHSPQQSSNWYKAIIKNYRVSVTGGCVKLTIDMVSTSYAFNKYNVAINISDYHMVIDKGKGTQRYTPYSSINPTNWWESSEFKTSYMNITKGISRDALIWGIRKVIDDYMGGEYEFDEEGSDIEDVEGDRAVVIEIAGLTPVQALAKIASFMVRNEEYIYAVEIDDTVPSTTKGLKKKIRFIKVKETESVSQTYTYNYNHKDGNVLDFSCEFQGVYSIYRWKSLAENEFVDVSLTTDSDGNYCEEASQNQVVMDADSRVNNGDISVNQLTEDIDKWMDNFHYSYKASMKVLGIVDNNSVGINTDIQVNVFINNLQHHTSGVYKVLKITDTIDSNGFFTNLEMVRIGKAAETRYSEQFNLNNNV